MAYALLAADGRLFAGLANGQLWASPDQGDSCRRCESPGAPSMPFSRSGPRCIDGGQPSYSDANR